MSSCIVRPFDIAHYFPALALWQRTPGVGLSAADDLDPIVRFLARNPGLSFIVELDGDVVGTILCGHDGRRGLIHHLVVDAQVRRRGLGSQLLDAALAGLRRQGIDKAHLLVFQSNSDGLAFWRRTAVERQELVLFSVTSR